MPTLYEYFGLLILFYSDEHLPIHVHGKHHGRESKAEILLRNGEVWRIAFSNVTGKRPLKGKKLAEFKLLVELKASDIVRRWDRLLCLSPSCKTGSHHAQAQMKAPKYISVEAADYVSDYKLRLRFNDRTERIVDFRPFLSKPRHPEIEQFRDLKKFRRFRLNEGDLMWGEYEMIFPVWDLYCGRI